MWLEQVSPEQVSGEPPPPGDKVRHDGGRLKRASEAIIGVISSFSAWGGKLIGEFHVTDVMWSYLNFNKIILAAVWRLHEGGKGRKQRAVEEPQNGGDPQVAVMRMV